jgi:hypothetical protein
MAKKKAPRERAPRIRTHCRTWTFQPITPDVCILQRAWGEDGTPSPTHCCAAPMVLLHMPARSTTALWIRRRLRFQAIEVKSRLVIASRREVSHEIRNQRKRQTSFPTLQPSSAKESAASRRKARAARRGRRLVLLQALHEDSITRTNNVLSPA